VYVNDIGKAVEHLGTDKKHDEISEIIKSAVKDGLDFNNLVDKLNNTYKNYIIANYKQ
jgi:hypothetical protein